MGKLTLLLLALLIWLQYSLWFGKNGLHDYSRVSDDVAAQQATNAKLKARNDQLFAEIDDAQLDKNRYSTDWQTGGGAH